MSVTEPSDAVHAEIAVQTEGQRLALSRKSLSSDIWFFVWFVRSFVAFKILMLPDVTFTVSSKLFIELKLSTGERIDLNSGRFMYMTAKFPFLK